MQIRRTKAVMVVASLTAALGCVGVLGASPAFAHSPKAARINKDLTCVLLDGNGNPVLTNRSHSVVTSSGNTTLKCSVKHVTPSSTGHAAHFKGFGCFTLIGFTTDSRETVSASGNATLTCRMHSRSKR